jgi:hypothetical protein
VLVIGEAAGVPIGNEQTSVGADQFAESIPILAIEPFDVQGGVDPSGGADCSFRDASFDRPRLRAAFTPPTVESTSSAISSRLMRSH